jgi:hypothetical protein
MPNTEESRQMGYGELPHVKRKQELSLYNGQQLAREGCGVLDTVHPVTVTIETLSSMFYRVRP